MSCGDAVISFVKRPSLTLSDWFESCLQENKAVQLIPVFPETSVWSLGDGGGGGAGPERTVTLYVL